MSVTLSVSSDQLTMTSLAYQPEVSDGNYKKLCLLDRYDRAGIKPADGGNLMIQSVQFGQHSAPTELTGLGYDTVGLTTQTTGFFAQYTWHAVVWPMLISVFEEEQNAGAEKIHDLAKVRMENVQGWAMRSKEQHLFAGGVTGYSALTTLNGIDVATGVFEANTPANQTHVFGGLSRGTFAAFPGWNHLYGQAFSTYASNGEATARHLINYSKQRLHPADVIFSSIAGLANHQRALGAHESFAKDEVSGRPVATFQGIPVEQSEYMPNAGATTGTAGSEATFYGLSMKGIPLVHLGKNKMRFLGWKDVPDRPVKIGLIIDISQVCPVYMGGSWLFQGGDAY